jgi:protein-S-isoprenylcysteine O-methyltransferase Ste14
MPSGVSVSLSITRAVAGQFIALCYAIFLLYWIIAAFWTKRTAEKPGWSHSWLIRGAVLVVLLLLTRRSVPGLPNRVLWAYASAIGIIAMALTALGLMILVWARATLAGNWSADVVLKENHELIERGPYRYVRHPIYSGVILMAFGCTLWWGTAVALVVMIGLPIVLWLKLSQEERLLTRHFPDEYPRYKLRTKALVPFII